MKRLLPVLLACAVFSCSTSVLASEQLSEELKAAARQGHFLACVPVIKDQLERRGYDFPQTMILQYCGCLGIQYFRDITRTEYKKFAKTNPLPNRIESKKTNTKSVCREASL